MNFENQIAIYVSFIAAMLALLRVIEGISGSQTIRKTILRCATISIFFLVVISIIPIVSNFGFHHLKNNLYLKTAENFLFSVWFILIAYQFGLGVVLRLYIRSLRFKDWGTVQNLRVIPPFNWIKNYLRSLKGGRENYEISPVDRKQTEKSNEIIGRIINRMVKNRKTILLTGKDPWCLRKKVVELIISLCKDTNEEINYICCSISPTNLWNIIEDQIQDKEFEAKIKRRLVFVDAYTETFGFGDEILTARIRDMKVDKNIEIVNCNSSAGIHSGTAKAFKILKEFAKEDNRDRRPCTVIYDSLSVLSIPETDTEVAEFIIHLSAAELTYDMRTIFLESDMCSRESASLDALRVCCGSPIEL